MKDSNSFFEGYIITKCDYIVIFDCSVVVAVTYMLRNTTANYF